MSKRANGLVRTHDMGRALMDKPNEFIRLIGWRRFWIVWDTNRAATFPTPDFEVPPAPVVQSTEDKENDR